MDSLNDLMQENRLLIEALAIALKHWEAVDPYYEENMIYKQVNEVYLDALSKRAEKAWDL